MRHRMMQAVRRAQKTVPFRVLRAFGESQSGNYASALAFSGFLAMFPMVLGALSIIGLMIRNPGTESHFQVLILQMFPVDAQPELRSAIEGVKQSARVDGPPVDRRPHLEREQHLRDHGVRAHPDLRHEAARHACARS